MLHLLVGTARARNGLLSLILIFLIANISLAQFETATVSGQVSDPSGLSVASAEVSLVDIDRGMKISAMTNASGLYRFPSVEPGRYRLEIRAAGFRVINFTGLTINVQDHLEQNFKLTVGSVSESVTVEGAASLVNTESAAVSTVVDRNFAENLPMNGRSFQTLIQLTPGVVLSAGNGYDQGQFNINGQRGYSNYWMVDGVSANVGINGGSVPGGGAAGALQASSAQGGTNSLVSIDALQEFRIQTSSYAPEFGRTPGGQISIVTRSGTNQWHGDAFEYLRNDVLDAADWFAKERKPEERQNDFGGTIGGPILKGRTFFFLSYEGLRLRQPQANELTVPSLSSRQNAGPSTQPFLAGFPLPNGPDIGNGAAIFNDTQSNRSTLDAMSIRVDEKLNARLNLFGRYNYSPSQVTDFIASSVTQVHVKLHTATLGATWLIGTQLLNDFRANYSRTLAYSSAYTDTEGGAIVPPLASLFPPSFALQNSSVGFNIFSLSAFLSAGFNSQNVQRQINVVDSFSWNRGSHSLKFGVDFRRLTPSTSNGAYTQGNSFADVGSAEIGLMCCFFANRSIDAYFLFKNLGMYAQDTWRASRRLTLTYGLRWDVDFAPSTTAPPQLPAISNCCNLATIALAPDATPVFRTTYGNVAPRLGLIYQFSSRHNWETVLRGGFGIFYDLATQEAAQSANHDFYPFGSIIFTSGTFPIVPGQSVPPVPDPTQLSSEALFAFDPNLKLPYTLEWNTSVQQAVGSGRSLSVSYIGAAGKRLTQTEYGPANANIADVALLSNFGTSQYDALQSQFEQHISHGLQFLLSHTWAHSIDTASASSFGTASNYFSEQFGLNSNRGPSDFDIRNTLTAALTYDLPIPKSNRLAQSVLGNWSLQTIVETRSALPLNVDDQLLVYLTSPGHPFADVRPEVRPGIPLYLYGPQYPGGKAVNNTPNQAGPGCIGPFCPPPTDPNTGVLLRQGNLGRNALRSFGATQWDFAVHRDFPIREAVKLQFRTEFFNILNHPNFGPPIGDISNSLFGVSTHTLASFLSNQGNGALSQIYQIGGPRSIQLALKLVF